jgi:thiamine-phosphate pyrophosphorylase
VTLRLELYVVTDAERSRGLGHLESARKALAGGADVVQLRDKKLPGRDLYLLALELRKLTTGSGALLIINDRVDVALAAGADGVHLGQDDLPVVAARRIAPRGFIIGASVGSVGEAVQAERDGADYIALSPLFNTGSKDDAGPGHGLEVLRSIRSAVTVPVLAIGGVDRHNVNEVIGAGADGVAVISAVLDQPDVEAATRDLRVRIRSAKGTRANTLPKTRSPP